MIKKENKLIIMNIIIIVGELNLFYSFLARNLSFKYEPLYKFIHSD